MNPELDDRRRAELRERLQRLRSEAEAALAQREDEGGVVELDQARQGRLSRMDALQAQAMARAAAERARFDLARIKAALRRLDDADFGLCEDCDAPIRWPRLELNPAVRLCIACAEQQERDS